MNDMLLVYVKWGQEVCQDLAGLHQIRERRERGEREERGEERAVGWGSGANKLGNKAAN
jgi:hypothetical protein